jgi:hypothetical protein
MPHASHTRLLTSPTFSPPKSIEIRNFTTKSESLTITRHPIEISSLHLPRENEIEFDISRSAKSTQQIEEIIHLNFSYKLLHHSRPLAPVKDNKKLLHHQPKFKTKLRPKTAFVGSRVRIVSDPLFI